jgi:fatty acid CoA ligase FadD9
MKVFFPGIAHDGYGSSETGGISVDGNLLPGVEIKLKDVPELGYFSTDTPFPRGELVVRTTTMFDGYFSGSLSETPKVSEDGWLETGDIVRIIGDRRIEVIDRKSSCVKLTNGKFVSLTGVEHVLGESELIGQVYVHVDPGDSSLIAVIVPELKNFRKFLTKKLGDSGKWENSELPEICGSEDASVEFLKEIRSLQKRFSSSPHELIRRVILEPEAFSVSNGLLNPSMKLCRPALSKKYSPMINQGIFPEIFSEGTSHSEKISKLIENVIGVPVGFNQKWTDIGIDSIASAQLAQKLSAHFGIMISVSSIFRSETPAGLLTRIASAQGGGPKKSDFAEETELLKKDISANLPSLHQHENERTNGITTVLLTGATGFFGAHLLQKLTDVPNVHVICLVRGDLQRLKDRMKFYGVTPNFEKVRVVSGDIALPNLGLSPEIFHSLRNSFDVLLHCAAKVNWLLPYSSLRAANTLPLFSLLSLTGTRPFHFISTIAVAAPGSCETRTGEPNVEYGYGASKWAAEALLERAGREKGARVYVYRPGHLVPVREGETKRGGAMGGMNEDDFLALLIRGCMEAGGFPSLEHEPQAEWTSVQTAASLVIASLMAREARDKKNLPTEFNLFTDSPTPYRTLFNFMNEKENFRLKEFGIPEWSEKVSDEKSPLHVLSHLVGHGLGGAGFGRSHANTNINYVLGGRPNWPKITRGSMEGWMSCVREREEGQGKVDKE